LRRPRECCGADANLVNQDGSLQRRPGTTANTTLRLRKPLTAKGVIALATTEWVRSDPISSTWLNTAIEPVD
jgi:hypothetical protein